LYQPLYKVCQDYLIACVENNLHSKISFPKDPWKIHTYLTSIGDKYINLQRKRVAFEVDGLKLPIQKFQLDSIQSVFYNGWTTVHYISNIFVFAPDGTVVSMVINAPGCLHDSTVSELGHIYRKLKICYENYNVRCVVDSAFCTKTEPYLIKSSQNPDVEATPEDVMVWREATAVRQLSEWV